MKTGVTMRNFVEVSAQPAAEPSKTAGVRAAASLPLRPEGVTAAAHIIGYKLTIRLLPKLDLNVFPVSNAAALRCLCAFALEVPREIRTLPVTDVRTLLTSYVNLRFAQFAQFSMTSQGSSPCGLSRIPNRAEVTVSTTSTLHQMQGTLQ